MTDMLQALDHITLRSADLARTIEFYQGLGLRLASRPPFRVPGCWLQAGGHPLLHVLEGRAAGAGCAFDHVAFAARGRAAISRRLEAAAVPFELHALPDGSALQMFLCDPDGARIELSFRDLEDC